MQLHYKQMGQGQPLVMLHGLFGSLDNWLGVAPKLAGSFRLYLVDSRNHGLSPHNSEMNYPIMARDLADFLDAQQLEHAIVLGHSMGGKTVMQFALDYPLRVEKLVVVDIAPRERPFEHEKIFKAMLALDLAQFQSRRQMEEALEPDIPDLTVRRFLLKNLKSTATPNSMPHFEWRIPMDLIYQNYPQICDAIAPAKPFNGPALFLRGGKSHFVQENDEPQIHRLFPQARIETIAAANHWVHADAPEEFLQHVLSFLKDNE